MTIDKIVKDLWEKADAAHRIDSPDAQAWAHTLRLSADLILRSVVKERAVWNFLDTNFGAAKALEKAGDHEPAQDLYDLNFAVIHAMAAYDCNATNNAVQALLKDAMNSLEDAPSLSEDGLMVALHLLQHKGDPADVDQD